MPRAGRNATEIAPEALQLRRHQGGVVVPDRLQARVQFLGEAVRLANRHGKSLLSIASVRRCLGLWR